MPTNKQTHISAVQMMDSFLHAVDMEKQASNLDLAGDAKSTHPSANVDDGTRPASEGARSAENEADVKKDVPATINDESSKNMAGGSDKPTDDQGTVSQDAEEVKGNVDTPKKDHSKSMSDSGPGDDTFTGDWDKASAALAKSGNDIVASITLLLKQAGEDGAAAEQPAAEQPAAAAPAAEAPAAEAPAAEAPKTDESAADDKSAADDAVALYKQAAEQYPDAMQAGYVAASMLAEQLGIGSEKSAADEQQLAVAVAGMRKAAEADAEMYLKFLQGYNDSLQKSGAGLEEMAALANGGGGMPGAEMGGMPMGDMGGAPGAEELAGLGAEGGEGGDEEASLEEIAAALDEAGVTPEELAAAITEAQGGAVPEEGGDAEDLGEEGSEEGGEEGEEEGEMEVPASAGKPATKKAATKKASTKKASNKAALLKVISANWK